MAEYVKISDLSLLVGTISTWVELSHLHPETVADRLTAAVEGVPTVELREERAGRHGGIPWPSRRLVGRWEKVDDG